MAPEVELIVALNLDLIKGLNKLLIHYLKLKVTGRIGSK